MIIWRYYRAAHGQLNVVAAGSRPYDESPHGEPRLVPGSIQPWYFHDHYRLRTPCGPILEKVQLARGSGRKRHGGLQRHLGCGGLQRINSALQKIPHLGVAKRGTGAV